MRSSVWLRKLYYQILEQYRVEGYYIVPPKIQMSLWKVPLIISPNHVLLLLSSLHFGTLYVHFLHKASYKREAGTEEKEHSFCRQSPHLILGHK